MLLTTSEHAENTEL